MNEKDNNNELTQYELKGISIQELLEQPINSSEYLIDGLLRQNDLGVVVGPPKIGKSTILINIAFALASGTKFVNRQCKKCKVLYIDIENRDILTQRRMQKMFKKQNGKDGCGDFDVIFGDQLYENNLRGNKIDYIKYFIKMYKKDLECGKIKDKYDVIIIDSFFYLTRRIDEDNSCELSYLVQSLKNLANETNAAIVFAAHTTDSSLLEHVLKGLCEMYISIDSYAKNDCFNVSFYASDYMDIQSERWDRSDYPVLKPAVFDCD